MGFCFAAARPLIHALPPEMAHNLGLFALRNGLIPKAKPCLYDGLQTELLGLTFSNPVGLAAGFDKNAVAVDALLAQGFGFVECGTVTPLAQAGNAKPRIFRLKEDRAVINRLGFNNGGLADFCGRLASRNPSRGVVGANIGKNKDAQDATADYVQGLRAVYAMADYITVNISSPNTQGLRDLQSKNALSTLLSAIVEARAQCMQTHGRHVPLLLKVAPDLSSVERGEIAEIVLEKGIEGLIVSNTTIARPSHLRSRWKSEAGGLSGIPLLPMANEGLADFYRLTRGAIILIGVGGISNAEDAYAKIRRGANLVQLYSALVYEGFGLVSQINRQLSKLLEKDGFTHISQAVGVDVTL